MRWLWCWWLASAAPLAFGASFEPVSVNYALHAGGEASFDAGVSAPPFRFGRTLWTHSLSYRQITLRSDPALVAETFRPTSFGYSTFLRRQLSEDWGGAAGISLSSKNARTGFRPKRDSLFWTGLMIFSRRLEGRSNASWSVGLIYPGRSMKTPVFPAAGLDYESESGRHQFRLGFPGSSYGYSPWGAHTRIGVFGLLDKASYLLPEASSQRANQGVYLSQQRWIAGLFGRTNIYGGYWLNGSAGYTFAGRTEILDRENDRVRKLDKEKGLYLSMGLSWRFQPPATSAGSAK